MASKNNNIKLGVRCRYNLTESIVKVNMNLNNEEDEMEFNDSDIYLLLPQKIPNSLVYQNENNNTCLTSIQLFIPFLLAGFGMVTASILLDIVQHWPVYQNVPEVYILVPALLGLKGNLEMTLASRLSTQANLGYMDNYKQQWKMIAGNLYLIQCQAVVIGFLASLAAVIMGWIPDGDIKMRHILLLCASSIVTSSAASFLLGVVMIFVVLLTRHFHINPDNVATPIAASLGDLTTLALLSYISSVLFLEIEKSSVISTIITVIGLISIPIWAWLSSKNPFTQKVLATGWTPVIFAMLISSISGFILDFTVSRYKGIAVFQLIINGVGGNLVAVHASRLSTNLHMKGKLGQLPPNVFVCINPLKIFFDDGQNSKVIRILILMVVPGHLIFIYTISYLQAGHTSLTPIFMAVYLIVAMLQVILLLYIAQVMILWMWKLGIDPDNSAIPYLTALGDLLGTLFLGLAFEFLYLIGDRDSDVGD